MSKDVNVIIVGDIGTGKSSLVELFSEALTRLEIPNKVDENHVREQNMIDFTGGDILVKRNVNGVVNINDFAIRKITTNDQLIVGNYYWARVKGGDGKIFRVHCASYDGWKYLCEPLDLDTRKWAHESNNQALTDLDVVGPIPDFKPDSSMFD